MIKIPLIVSVLFIVFACKSKTQNDAENTAEQIRSMTNPTSPTGAVEALAAVAGSEVVGEWEKSFYGKDKNDNGKIEEDEKESAENNWGGSSYFLFNDDGTCQYESIKLVGFYEVKDDGGQKTIFVYPALNGQPSKENALRYRIFSGPTSNEMVLSISGVIVGYRRTK